MIFYPNGEPFSSGAVTYAYHPVTELERSPRIFLTVSFGWNDAEDGIDTEAFLDTGAPYVICKPQIAYSLGLDPQAGEYIENVNIRGYYLNGYLYRLTVTLLAEIGEHLPVDATVFVPELTPYQEWEDFPSILGLTGFLERIRFAIDPGEDRFYFGSP